MELTFSSFLSVFIPIVLVLFLLVNYRFYAIVHPLPASVILFRKHFESLKFFNV